MILVAAGLAGCSGASSTGGTEGDRDVAAGAAAVAAQLPSTEPSVAASVAAGAPPGSVTVCTGPFIDRLRLSDLLLTGSAGGSSSVTGHLDVVSDVSEIIALEIRVDFYDVAGRLVGSAQQVFDPAATEVFHTTAGVVGLPFSVTAPVAGANSAVLSVPVLVNE